MEENRNNNEFFGEQYGSVNNPSAEGLSPNNISGPSAQEGTAPNGTPECPQQPQQQNIGGFPPPPPQVQSGAYPVPPQNVTPPFPGAVMMLGADGKYYWVLQNPTFPIVPQVQKPAIPEGFTENTFRERKEIRRQALSLGFAFLSISLIPRILYYIANFILSTVIGSENAREVMSGAVYGEIAQILFSIVAFTVPFIIFSKTVGKQNLSETTGFKKPIKGLSLPMFFFGIAFCGFAQFATDIGSSFFSQFFDYNVSFGERADGVTGVILSVISTAITPALVEEFACRGIALGSLRKYGDGIAVFASSILFGVMHGNFQQIPFAFLVGLVLGYIRIKSGSIWICCAVHGFNNLLSVVYETLSDTVLTNTQTGVLYIMVIIVCFLLGFFALSQVADKKELFKFEKSTLECTGQQKFKWFFTSPVIIIFLAEELLQSLIYFLPNGISSLFNL